MQNIDPLYFLQPVGTIAFSVGLIIYWHRKRHFTRAAFVYSLLAYAGAIAIKIVVQVLTYNAFLTRFGNSSPALGAYFGVQTVLFEVGGAFLVAAWAVSRGKLNVKDAEGYGLGLAFWENAGYLGVLGVLSLASIYLALASGGSAAQEFYSSMSSNRPDLFYSPSLALPLVGYGLLERVTSLLFHFSWGYLCLLAAFLHRRQYFLLALPMGLVDFFVPFAASLGILVFEAFIFVLGLGSLGLTLLVTRSLRHHDRPAEGLAAEFKKAVSDDAPDLTDIMTRAFDDDARSFRGNSGRGGPPEHNTGELLTESMGIGIGYKTRMGSKGVGGFMLSSWKMATTSWGVCGLTQRTRT